MKMEPLADGSKLTIEKIVDLIRSVRNDLIKDFLDGDNLASYFSQHYNKELSKIKIIFIKKELSELLIAPVDLTHYAPLINKIRKSNSVSMSQRNHGFFYSELESVFKKYDY